MAQRRALASPDTSRLLQRGLHQTPRMKLTTMALTCLLLAAVWPQDVNSMSLHVASSHCCYSFVQKISLQRIQCYKDTSVTCPYKAVIFKLMRGREVCALQTLGWVQGYLKKMKPC